MANPKAKYLAFVLAIVALSLMIGSTADAAQKQWWLDPEVQANLGLTPEQQQRIAAVEDEYRPRLMEVIKKKQAAYKSAIRALDHGTLSDEELAKTLDATGRAYHEFAAVHVEKWNALRAILTLEQWKDLPEAAPYVIRLGDIATTFRGKVHLGEPAKGKAN